MSILQKESATIPIMHPSRLFFAIGCFVILSVTKAAAADWPEGYIVYEESKSPYEKYAILISSLETAENDESAGETNYLADLEKHQLLGKIRGADYFENQNHRGLRVTWAPDSSWCIVEYDGRFGFATISILELKGSSFAQTDIGKQIDKSLTAAIAKQSHDRDVDVVDTTTYFRIDADRKVRVRAVSTTDPKQLQEKGGYYALFRGTFDVRSKKWLMAEARPLTRNEYDGVGDAFGDLELDGTTFATEEDKAKALDDRMNEAYLAVRLVLPPTRFAKIKKEQIEWLKKRDATSSVEEKCKLMEARIKALQELLW
jgi:hypothetical protein